jgi:hypothetical protein
VRIAGRINTSQFLGQVQISVKAAYREQEERQRARTEATSAATKAGRASGYRQVEKLAIFRDQERLDADQIRLAFHVSAELDGGELLTKQERNKIQSWSMKAEIHEHQKNGADNNDVPRRGDFSIRRFMAKRYIRKREQIIACRCVGSRLTNVR